MKKIIIGMLLLLPLIIVASVMLAIDVITVEAYIAVDRVELNHTSLELELSAVSYDGLVATVYPTGARNKKVIWSIEDAFPTVEYDGEIAEIDPDTGKIMLYSYGTFTVVVRTEDGNKTAVCNVYIKGDKVKKITLNAGKDTLETGESLRLDAVFYPIDAIVKDINWNSNNPSVIKVDQNGIVTAINEGEAKIRVEAGDAYAEYTLIAVRGVSKYGSEIYLSSQKVNLDDILFVGWSLSSVTGGTVSGNEFTFNADEAVLATNRGSITLKKCGPDEIIIENAAFFEGYTLKTGKLPVILTAVYKDCLKGTAGVSWQSSDTSVAEIDSSGRITGKGKGSVLITATMGTESASIEIDVIKPVSLIVLDKNTQTEKRGIAATTLYGNKVYGPNGLEPAVIDIGITFPADATPDEFIFETDNAALAVFNEPGKLSLTGDFAGGKNVTVTVTAKVSPYASVSVSRSFTIKVYNGVNCYTFEDLKRAAGEGLGAFLHSDIEYGGPTLELRSSLYGNGYILSGINYAGKDKAYNMLKIMSSNVTVSNLRIVSDDPSRISISDGLRGYALVVGDKALPERISGVRIEYCTIEDAYYCIDIHKSEISIEGSILRNCSNFGVNIENEKLKDGTYDYSDVTFKNCVMSNIVAPAITVTSKNETDVQSTLKIQGFLDIYNWQQLDSMRMLDRKIIENEGLNEIFTTLLKNLLKSEFQKSRYDDVRYDKDGISYLHLGIIMAGALHECNTVPEFEGEDRLYKFVPEVLHDGSIIPISLKPVTLYVYKPGHTDILPGDEPAEDLALYARLRGK